jgi:hypothetical protein
MNLKPLGNTFSHSFECDENGAAPIPGLGFSRSPATILWRIWAFIIYSIEREPFRATPHVFIKRSETFSPFGNYENTLPPYLA